MPNRLQEVGCHAALPCVTIDSCTKKIKKVKVFYFYLYFPAYLELAHLGFLKIRLGYL